MGQTAIRTGTIAALPFILTCAKRAALTWLSITFLLIAFRLPTQEPALEPTSMPSDAPIGSARFPLHLPSGERV